MPTLTSWNAKSKVVISLIIIIMFAAKTSGTEVTESPPSYLANDDQIDNLADLTSTSPEQAADLWIQTLKQLGPGEDVQGYAESLGFKSTQEAAQAELGRPIRLYRILDLSKALEASTPIEKILVDTHAEMFPLLVEGQARSAAVVSSLENDKVWVLSSIGYTDIIQQLEKYRTVRTNRLITVSSLGLRFLGEGKGAGLLLIPIVDSYGLKPGAPVPARETISELARRIKPY